MRLKKPRKVNLRELGLLRLQNDGKMAYYALANRGAAALATRTLHREVA